MSERPKKLGPRVTVSVTPGDYDVLNKLAERDDVSVSWVIRRAIQEYLRRHRSSSVDMRKAPVKHPSAPQRA
ncbi:ribbon-helix-helix protein, CopG family [Aminobacter sp. BE110]